MKNLAQYVPSTYHVVGALLATGIAAVTQSNPYQAENAAYVVFGFFCTVWLLVIFYKLVKNTLRRLFRK